MDLRESNQPINKAKMSISRQSLIYKSYGFSSGRVQMLELDYKEDQATKN